MVMVPATKVFGKMSRPFEIDRTEVPVSAYLECVKAGACSPPSKGADCSKASDLDYPANCTEYDQTEAYCRWAGKRLPTEPEWRLAAYGSPPRRRPWGGAEPTAGTPTAAKLACNGFGVGTSVCKVDERPAGASPFGALDMEGNVMEWLQKGKGPEYQAIGSCSCNGTSQDSAGWPKTPASKTVLARKSHDATVGFRCARDVEGSAAPAASASAGR
jgi:formylglycine-generating enzyme required for sulfatase activity